MSHLSTVRVLICDDHVVFRRGLRLVLADEPGVEVVGEADDAPSAVQAAADLAPDVVLMDLRMPGGGGISATEQILAKTPATRVLMLTVSDADEDLIDAVGAGAVGYLLKEVSIEEVGAAVQRAAAGETLLSPAMTAKLFAGVRTLTSDRAGAPAGSPQLSQREQETLEGIVRGLTNKAIAAELDIAENTVKNHVRSVLEKLGVATRTEAAMAAVRLGLVASA